MPVPGLSANINSKLGPAIHAWSVPADEGTCIGASPLCAARCYAKRGHFVYGRNKEFYARNKEFAQTDEFVDWMSAEMRRQHIRVLRIHVSGDFFDEAYTRKWEEIARRVRRVRFFAYTRSWRSEDVFPALVSLSQVPNFRLWFSLDRLTGPAPLVPNVRRAYMAVSDADAKSAPDDCELVFRVRPQTVMKRANGVLVCPAENGVEGKLRHTCTTCQICWSQDARANWEDDLLIDRDDGFEINAPEVSYVGSQP